MVGVVPVVPAGERSAAGIGSIEPLEAVVGVPPAVVVVVVADGPLPVLYEVLATFEDADVFDGDELQAARPTAPAAPSTRARVQGRWGSDMGRDGSRSLWARRCTRRGGVRREGPAPGARPVGPGRPRPFMVAPTSTGDASGANRPRG